MVFHPDLRLARFLPRTVTTPALLPVMRFMTRMAARTTPPDVEVVAVGEQASVRVFRPASGRRSAPALLWIHGGGYVAGNAAFEDTFCREVAGRLDVVVASVEYRLAPEHPFPAPLDDCYAGLRWLADDPGVDRARIAIGGASAGGGLAAGLALMARDRGEIAPVFQLLVYPMLDDRTADRADIDPRTLRVWSQRSNRFGWRSYLGSAVKDVPYLAAAGRCEDLTGLPPAWIGVGTADLFHDEDVRYAARLTEAGVPCALEIVPGAYHGFDAIERSAGVSRQFTQTQLSVLDAALNVAD
ncbi:alpha/beta hydrolase [Kutzneria sp. CA-103260]|nr:alpha/beta hydrolase [Kutzneria sp. CA-103260]